MNGRTFLTLHRYPDLRHISQSSKDQTSTSHSFSKDQNALLSVSLTHLDSETEMRKFFGSKVVCMHYDILSSLLKDCQISASKAQEKQPRGARAAIKGLKSHLTKPQPTWWSASQREGLSIRPLSDEELKDKATRSKLAISDRGDRWWTVEYSKRYRNVTKAFISAVMSGGKCF